MAVTKNKSVYVCQSCGYESVKWYGRCPDCGECSLVCPQNIPLHLLNRKFIKDMDTLYGDYQAGENSEGRHPLINFTKADAEPSVVLNRGE